jgi:hypothetical protein
MEVDYVANISGAVWFAETTATQCQHPKAINTVLDDVM